MAIVLNPGKQQDQSHGEMFCWNELPELLLVDDLFGSQKDCLPSIPTIISEDEDEDEDEDWDDDEEYEDEEFEDEDEGEEFEEGDEESDDESDDDEYRRR